jgi:hypothetical protein
LKSLKRKEDIEDFVSKDITDMLQYMSRERDSDIREFNNLKSILVLGRKVAKVPTSSADVDPSDRVGDQNYDENYLYILIDNSGTAEWRRVAVGSW